MSQPSDGSPDYCNSCISASASSQARTQHGVLVEVCVRAEVGSAHTACHCICCCRACFVGDPGHVLRAMASSHLCCCGFPDRQSLTLVCRQIRVRGTCRKASRCTVIMPEHAVVTDMCLTTSHFAQAVFIYCLCCLCCPCLAEDSLCTCR